MYLFGRKQQFLDSAPLQPVSSNISVAADSHTALLAAHDKTTAHENSIRVARALHESLIIRRDAIVDGYHSLKQDAEDFLATL